MTQSETKPFDPTHELLCIQSFLRTRWDNLPSDFWTVLRFLGTIASRDGLRFVDNHCVFELATKLRTERMVLLKGKLPFAGAEDYDRPYQVLSALQDANHGYRDALIHQGARWDWEKRIKALTIEVLSFCPELAQARPCGWAELETTYDDFDGMEEYCQEKQPADEAAFQGVLRSSMMGANFVQRTALPYVMYGAVGQGSEPAHALVDAVFAHILLMREAANNEELVQAVRAMPLKLEVPELVLDLDLVFDSTAPVHLRGLLAYMEATEVTVFIPEATARKQFEAVQAFQAGYAELSEAQKAVQAQESDKELEALIAQLTSQPSEDKSSARREKFVQLLRERAPELVA